MKSVLFLCLTVLFNASVQGTPCNPLCGTGVYTHAGTCQPSGKCLCHWGWTGPNAAFTTNNKILADYCRVPCHYTHDYANPECVNANHTSQECRVPTTTTPTKPCDPRCGKPPYHGRGQCLSDGRCLCWWGWTGPESCYVEDGIYENRIIADYCVTACHYTPIVRNATCLNGSWAQNPPTKKVVTKTTTLPTSLKCDPLCGTGVYTHAGTCQPSGKCLCHWGWTGPNAAYTTNNKILADYCRVPCHYTHDYANPECVNANHTSQECRVPTTTTPTKPCDPRCGKPPYHGRGQCLSDGRCLCWWGWTGPESCYVEDGIYENRIIADYCVTACHHTPIVRNATCLNGSWAQNFPTKKVVKKSITLPTSLKCDPLCGTGVYTHAGTCQPSGKCLCHWGWTGPNAEYTSNNKILADYCRTPCHFTRDYTNPDCAKPQPHNHKCELPSLTGFQQPCDSRCGQPPNHGKGRCLKNGRCLCWWGWTGPHACYLNGGYFNNRIVADYCEKSCHYTHDVRNLDCLDENTVTGNRPKIARRRQKISIKV